jgi:integrase
VAGIERREPRTTGGRITYRVRYRDPAGTQRSRTFPTRTMARTFQATVEADKFRGTYVDQALGRITLGEYAQQWLAIQTFGPSTREQRALSIRLHLTPLLGSTPLSALSPSQIQAWVRALSSNLSRRTVQGHFSLLSTILGAAVDDERITKNPCRAPSIRVPKPDERRLEPWTIQQVASIRKALPERYLPLLTIVTGLGLRQGEVFGLAVDDVDFLRRIVTVRRQVSIVGSRLVFALPKGRKVRTVPLPGSVADDLAGYLQAFAARQVTLPWGTPDGGPASARLLLTTREGKPLNRNYINSHVWRPALSAAGVPIIRDNMMHGGRHFYANLQLEHGMSPRALADYLGHTDPAFMMRTYTHLMPEAEGKAQTAVDIVFARVREVADSPSKSDCSGSSSARELANDARRRL